MKSDRGRTAQIKAFVELCLSELDHKELTNQEIVKEAQLCLGTIYRLRNGRVSTKSHVGTLQKLGEAAGYTNGVLFMPDVEPAKKVAPKLYNPSRRKALKRA